MTALLPLAAALIWASAATAATRYASPSGDASNPSCPESDPCDIETAVEHGSVMSGDEVIVLPGIHDIGAGELTVGTPSGGVVVDLHGQAGQPLPEVTGTGPRVVHVLASATVRDLQITGIPAGGNGTVLSFDGNYVPTAERLHVFARGSEVVACSPVLRFSGTSAVLRDSVCHAEGESGDSAGVGASLSAGGPLTLVSKLVNVTAIGSGVPGIRLKAGVNADLTLNATNVIASSDVVGVEAVAGDATSAATINLDYSNYATMDETDSGGTASVTPAGSPTNQTDPPLFADALGGDYHQAPLSPTRDAGTGADPLLGAMDVDREQRVIGPAPDIGADEFALAAEPPPPTCKGQPATRVGTPGADTIRGTAGRDVVVALGGADRILTGAGNDLVCAGPGADRIFTRGGVDRAFGEAGVDRIFGGAGRDFLFGQRGFDRLFGGPGHDRALGGPGRDLLIGHAGRDRLFGGAGRDALRGLAGRPDRCFGGAGPDVRRARGCEIRRSIP